MTDWLPGKKDQIAGYTFMLEVDGISEATFESMSLRTWSNTLAAEILKGYRELDSSRVTSTATDGMTAAEIRRAFEKTMGWK